MSSDITPPPKPESLDELLQGISEVVYERIRNAVALGKWENGDRLSPTQLEHCLQLIIAYESRLPPDRERTGSLVKQGAGPACRK